MEKEHAETINADTLTEGFSRIPHALFNALLVIDLTSRERRVLELILRLTYNCLGQRWARFNLSDFQVVGIRKSHARAVIDGLLKRQLILQYDHTKAYRINEECLATEVTKSGTFQLNKLTELIGRQLQRKTYQNGNQEVPEIVTSGLPNKELTGSQTGNSGRFPKRELLTLNNDRIPESIDTVKIIKNSDRNTIAFENPKTFISSNAEEQAALDAWKELESFNPYAFNTTYLKAARRGLPAHLFYQFVSEIKQSNAEKPGAVFNKKVADYFESHKKQL